MRIRVARDELSVHAFAGTEVVLFGIDLSKEMTAQTQGFGLERIGEEKQARQPMLGLKTFA